MLRAMMRATVVLGAAVLFTVLAFTGRPGVTPRSVSAATNCDVAAASMTQDGEEQAFLVLINNYRAANGAPALGLLQSLNRASTWMAQDMASYNYFNHTDRLGRQWDQRLEQCDVAGKGVVPWSENIAAWYDTAASVFEGWRNSAGHNANMLNPAFRSIGIARVASTLPGAGQTSPGWYWVNNFSGEAPGAPPPAVPPPSPAAPCRNAALSVNPVGNTVNAGATVTFTASGQCGGTPVYKWWIGVVGGGGGVTWVLERNYSTSNTFTLTPTNPGNYYVAVWMANEGGADNTYDVDSYTPITVARPSPCHSAVLTSIPAGGTLAANTTQTFTASAACNGTPVYKWWVGRIGAGGAVDWVQMSPYGPGNTFAWTPTLPGSYWVAFWVQNQGSPDGSFDTDGYVLRTVN